MAALVFDRSSFVCIPSHLPMHNAFGWNGAYSQYGGLVAINIVGQLRWILTFTSQAICRIAVDEPCVRTSPAPTPRDLWVYACFPKILLFESCRRGLQDGRYFVQACLEFRRWRTWLFVGKKGPRWTEGALTTITYAVEFDSLLSLRQGSSDKGSTNRSHTRNQEIGELELTRKDVYNGVLAFAADRFKRRFNCICSMFALPLLLPLDIFYDVLAFGLGGSFMDDDVSYLHVALGR